MNRTSAALSAGALAVVLLASRCASDPPAAPAVQSTRSSHCPHVFLAADDADGFASALVSVLTGEGDKLGRRGRELTERQLSVEALTRQLAADELAGAAADA